MSDRSYCAITTDVAPGPLSEALSTIFDEAAREGGEFTWEEINLSHAEEVAAALRQAAPDLTFTAQQESRYEVDGYRITAVPGRPLREVTLSASGRVVVDPRAVLDLLAGAATVGQARAAVSAYFEAEGAL